MIGADLGTIVMTTVTAAAVSSGGFSPDMDQSRPWVWINRHTPGFLDPLLAHRRLSHWWGLPVIAWLLISTLMPAHLQVPFTAMLVGWTSHLVGDFFFGRLSVWPWGGPRFGFTLDTGGFIETGKTRVAGKTRTVVPFGPVRVVMVLGLGLLVAWPTVAELYRGVVGGS